MRRMIVTLAALAATAAGAHAGCRLEGSYPGRIGKGAKHDRTFYLTPGKTQINVVAESANDRLIMWVTRPSGAMACKKRGPDSLLECTMTALRSGNHHVHIKNPMRRSVEYTMQCWNAG